MVVISNDLSITLDKLNQSFKQHFSMHFLLGRKAKIQVTSVTGGEFSILGSCKLMLFFLNSRQHIVFSLKMRHNLPPFSARILTALFHPPACHSSCWNEGLGCLLLSFLSESFSQKVMRTTPTHSSLQTPTHLSSHGVHLIAWACQVHAVWM